MVNWKETKCGKCKIQRKRPVCNSCFSYDKFIPIAITNADRIREMSDDELAMNMMCPNENGLGEIECEKSDNCNCYACILKWLQSEVEVDNFD